MALSGVYQIVMKYRNRTADELNQCLINLCRLLSSFSTIDKQIEPMIASLRELFLMLQMSPAERRVPDNVATLFLTALQDLKVIHPQLLTLTVACMAGICPSDAIRIDLKSLESLDVGRIPVFLHLLQQQELSPEFGHATCVQLVKCLNDAVAGPGTKKAILSFFIRQYRGEAEAVMFQDCFDVICWSMANWLVNASAFDEAQHEKSKRTTKSVALLSVTELDGSTPSESFTVLSLARTYAEDQELNILCFSLLYDTLLSVPGRNTMERIDDDLSLAMPLATLQGRVKATSLEDVAFDYCLQLLKQSEVRPVKSSYDCELQDAVISESVRILDLLCLRNPKLVRRAFRSVVDVNDRAMRKIHNSLVLLGTFQFLLNHREGASFEMDNLCHFMCCDFLPGAGLLDNIFASEFLALLRKNRNLIRAHTKLFSRYFPSILKPLAWNPRSNMHLFVDLLPWLITSTSYLEVFHLLVDLPCVSASLEVSIFGEGSFLTAVRQLAQDRIRDQRLKFFLEFFLRNESGRGDLPDSVTDFHRALVDVAAHPRVIYCSQAVSALLSIFFYSMAELKGELSYKKLVTALLERMHTLYTSYAEIDQMQAVMADGFCLLVSREPAVLVEICDKVSDYIMANHFMYTTFLTSLVWCIGERVDATLGVEQPGAVVKLYDAVEFLTYDIIKTQSKNLVNRPQDWSMDLFQTSLTTMTRLGALTRDLTRRAVICLNNVVKKTREHPDHLRLHIIEQIDGLIRILELPSVSEIVMNLSTSPEPEVLEAIKRLKSVADEYNELYAAQSPPY